MLQLCVDCIVIKISGGDNSNDAIFQKHSIWDDTDIILFKVVAVAIFRESEL